MTQRKVNRLKRIKIVQEIVQKNYIEGVTTYKGIWREYVYPLYPMSYPTFVEYINTIVPRNANQYENKRVLR